jgi:hypothetical protein
MIFNFDIVNPEMVKKKKKKKKRKKEIGYGDNMAHQWKGSDLETVGGEKQWHKCFRWCMNHIFR